MTTKEEYEYLKFQPTAYPSQAVISYGWVCPTCGMVNGQTRAIYINSWLMQHGTSVEWKHYLRGIINGKA